MKKTIYEILFEISEQRGNKKKISKLHENSSKILKTVLSYTYDPNIKWLVTPGIKYKPCDDSVSSMISRLQGEIASGRIATYVNTGPYPNLDQKKRDNLWQTLLENIHPDDATLLAFISEHRELPFPKLNKKIVAEAFPLLSRGWKLDDN